MAINAKQSGTVLIIALIFCAASSMLMLLQFETRVLETAMLNHSLSKKWIHFSYISDLSKIEQLLADLPLSTLPSGITFLQWIPDTLLCDEQDGIVFYRIDHNKAFPDGTRSQFATTFAVRGSLPKGQSHPNEKNCAKEPEVIPLSIRNGIGILNDDEYVMLFDIASGEFLRQEKLVPVSLSEPITPQSKPKMLVRKPIEKKRLILCPTTKGWAQAEIEVDYAFLGRRTWHES
ncbi:MAG: hypothetical protein AB7I18_05580 [Candidatus Berkiella sp.]